MFMASAVFPMLGRAASHDHFRLRCSRSSSDPNSAKPVEIPVMPPLPLVKSCSIGLDRFHDLVLHGKHLAFKAIFADGENSSVLLRRAGCSLRPALRNARRTLSVLSGDDLRAGCICRGRSRGNSVTFAAVGTNGEQTRDERSAADALEQVADRAGLA